MQGGADKSNGDLGSYITGADTIAYKTPVFVVAGGRGAHNAPEIVTAPEMDLRRVGWAIPENYCRCHEWNHQCDKRIVNFDSKFEAWLNEVVLSGIKQRAGIPS